MKKKMLVYAYYNVNLGDDLFIDILSKKYPKTNFILFAPKRYKKIFKHKENIKVISNDTFMKKVVYKILKFLKINTNPFLKTLKYSCDGAINIGGSLFMEDQYSEREYQNRKKLSIKDKPFFLLGANFGPYYSENFYKKYKQIFCNYTDICFRDQYSYNLFKDLPNVRIADDIVFQYEPNLGDKKNIDKYVVISVIKPSYRENLTNYDSIYFNKITECIFQFHKQGYKIVMMSFCEKEKDNKAIDKILQLLPKNIKEDVNKHSYTGDIDESIDVLAKSDYIIATRFHAMILGWVLNKPVYPIAYSEKMVNVLKDTQFQGNYSRLIDLEKVKALEITESIILNKHNITKQVNNSKEHFKILDQYIN